MKKTIILFLLVCIIFTCFSCSGAEASSPFIPTEGLSIIQFVDSTTEIAIQRSRQDHAHQMAECARALGYSEEHMIIQTAKQEWYASADLIQASLKEEAAWNTKFEEHPYATYVWLFLTRQLGYSNEVAAGIVGNMMIEVGGGGTLDLQYWAYGSNGFYYGICQWGKTWFPEVRGMDLIGQCEYLASNIETQINAFGQAYGKGNAFSEFLQSTSCRDAALMFAKWYEACDSGSYGMRQNCAEKAYEYFVTGLN